MRSSARQQVGGLVALSVVLSHAAWFLILLTVFGGDLLPVHTRADTAGAALVARLYDGSASMRPALLTAATGTGLRLRALDPAELARCRPDHPPMPPGRAALPSVACAPPLAGGVASAFQTPGGAWLGLLAGSRDLYERHHPQALNIIIGLVALVGAPTLMLSLWASRRVTAPLRELAASAEQIDAERIEAQDVNLPAGGTTEIRQLTDALRGLIGRVRDFASEQRTMVAGISHDLRTPLTRLRLRLEAVEDPVLRETLTRDVETMRIIVESSLSLERARQDAFTRQEVDLGALLQTVADNAQDAGHDVTLDGALHLALRCDPGMMTRAIDNVVDNAVKFGGHARLHLGTARGRALISIQDDGPGIPGDMKNLVFKPYFRGDAARTAEGTGLGLSITRAVVEAHGGTITLADVMPRGLCVRIELPIMTL